jgi:arylsulfatase A-like enzyme
VVRAGSTSDRLVSNLDFAGTFLEAAGLPIPSDMQGRSLLALLRGQPATDWRKSFYYHYYEYPVPHHVRPHYGVVTDRYKLVRVYGPDTEYWELFDLANDAHEMTSVYDRPEYADTQRELHAELGRLRADLKVPDQDPAEASGRRLDGERRKAGGGK